MGFLLVKKRAFNGNISWDYLGVRAHRISISENIILTKMSEQSFRTGRAPRLVLDDPEAETNNGHHGIVRT
jgi:hypothetical protein